MAYISDLTVNDFSPGIKVRYVPRHAHGDLTHKDVENGIVKSTNDKYVFVNYIRNGILQETAQATDPRDLLIG